jgi:hypothetical protein
VIPSAPPLSCQMRILAGASEPQRGRAQGHLGQASKFPLATLPSLFDPLRRSCALLNLFCFGSLVVVDECVFSEELIQWRKLGRRLKSPVARDLR